MNKKKRKNTKNRKAPTSLLKKEVFNFDDYFNNMIIPELDKVSTILSEINNSNQNYVDIVRYWWHTFYINSGMFQPLFRQKYSFYQVAMTTRLLLEISADLHFISNNLDNIPRLIERQQQVHDKQEKNKAYSHRDSIKDSCDFFLLDNKGRRTRTENRIQLMNNQTLLDLYGELSSASHFNHIRTIWEGNKNKDDDFIKSIVYCFSFYPLIFEYAVKSIGKIIDEAKLENFDIKIIDKNVMFLFKKVNDSKKIEYNS